MPKYHSINGQIEATHNAHVNITDLGLLRGYAIFDYFQIRDGRPFFMDDHLHRFYRSAKRMSLEVPFEMDILKAKIMELYTKNDEASCGIRLVLSGGNSLDGFSPEQANLFILQHPFKSWKPEMYTSGASLITHEHVRIMPEVKTTNYFTAILLIPQMKAANATDVLYHDSAGWISETSRSNFFIVNQDNQLITATDKILHGITRMHTLRVAREIMDVQERAINLSELNTAKEAFITSTTMGVMPIVMVGGVTIGDGKPGEMTLRLHERIASLRSE